MKQCLDYMIKHGRLGQSFAAVAKVAGLVERQGWYTKK